MKRIGLKGPHLIKIVRLASEGLGTSFRDISNVYTTPPKIFYQHSNWHQSRAKKTHAIILQSLSSSLIHPTTTQVLPKLYLMFIKANLSRWPLFFTAYFINGIIDANQSLAPEEFLSRNV